MNNISAFFTTCTSQSTTAKSAHQSWWEEKVSKEERGRESFVFFFFNDTATTEISTLSLHDALPICSSPPSPSTSSATASGMPWTPAPSRSEEHTSELQSLAYLVCRLLLEKKKN